MSGRMLVIPFNLDLLSIFAGRNTEAVIKINHFNEILPAARHSADSGIKIHALVLKSHLALSAIPFSEEWKNIPLAIFIDSIGKFSEFINKRRFLLNFNMRIYLPAGSDKKHSAIQVLSSLGIQTCITFGPAKPDWDNLNDLMTYALLGRISHAPVEPFNYMASNYENFRTADFNAVYFNDPERFIHINEQGRVALTNEDLIKNKFLNLGISEINGLENTDEFIEYKNKNKKFFLEKDGCAYCPGWRLCAGRLINICDDNCVVFFDDMIDVIERYKKLSSGQNQIWQP